MAIFLVLGITGLLFIWMKKTTSGACNGCNGCGDSCATTDGKGGCGSCGPE
jgi:hypothetical protein